MRILAAILLLSPALALADDVRCLQSSGSGKPIQLQLTLFTSAQGGWRGAGQVQYRGQPDSLPIVFKDSEEIMAVEGRPSEFRSTWLEVLPAAEKLGGRYQFHHQGAVLFAFTYTSASGKVFAFEETPAALDANNTCSW
ncbi:hypothetical protein A9179_22020 [Pseudomonas alcaligenes]|uniref:Uncharacterized protein n=1 Tax=Aquipseudomonas alcaligenes TaxID=43263 RepID=A0ABR7S895_AQUAC|nr:hypothetical protein [Pseudomonas alcaligenes]MBC9252947.1 hypothetical protein [Pseudomonas alcaligenes]